MKKQSKKPGSPIAAPQPFKHFVGKKPFTGQDNPSNETDADELVHQQVEEHGDNTAFDKDEAVHKANRRNTEPGSVKDMDDLVHENSEEDSEPIF